METKGQKPFYESRVYWGEVMILPLLNMIVFAFPMIMADKVVEMPAVVFATVYAVLVVVGTFFSAKYVIRKYVFYDDRLKIVYPRKKSRTKTILYSDVAEVYYYRAEMPKLSSRMILKLKTGKRKGLEIEEKYVRPILQELEKRNVKVSYKVKSIYNRFQ